MTDYAPLPPKYDPTVGQRLVYKPEDKEFTVLCSCASSFPKHFTRRAIKAQPSLYALPVPAQTAEPKGENDGNS